MRYLTEPLTEYEKALRDYQNEFNRTGTISDQTKQKVADARKQADPQLRAFRLMPANQKHHIPCALRGKK